MASFHYLAPPFKHTDMTWERIDKFISTVYFSDVNLCSRLFKRQLEPISIRQCKVDGRFCFKECRQSSFNDIRIGDSFGPTWSTHWVKVEFQLPSEFLDGQADDDEVLFHWNSGCEATLWDEETCCPIAAFSSGGPFGDVREYLPVSKSKLTSQRVEYLIEVACNAVLGDGGPLFISPPKGDTMYQLKKCQLVVRRNSVYKLIRDLTILKDIAKELEGQERGYVALYTANNIINILLDAESPNQYDLARKMADKFFSESNGIGQHVVKAIGHCHIDCAWLWPYEESVRKCGRSWVSVVELMERYPGWKFACSSAQQFEWVKVNYPVLFEQIKSQVKSGRFVPVGGSWVEMDGNLPSGESMCRQLRYGQQFFKKHFGLLCTEFWLPDTFGYSCQLPQILKHFGIDRFVSHKLSWNLFNKFPHHTFYWRGIDGSRVLTHFPPGSSYHQQCTVKELLAGVKNFQEKGRSSQSVCLFGHGDGGQGPTQEMLESLERLQNINGLPRVEFSSPSDYFEFVEKNESKNLCSWSGELYLEMHQGTYTTQSKLKWYNRKCETLLHNLEFACTLAHLYSNSLYPYEQLDSLWKDVLLNQFHDVLPGSSIWLVNEEAKKMYKNVLEKGRQLLESSMSRLVDQEESVSLTIFNTLGWPRQEVVNVDLELIHGLPEQFDLRGKAYQLVTCDGFSFSSPGPMSYHKVTVEKLDDVICMSNGYIYAEIDHYGRISVLKTKELGLMKSSSQAFGRNLLSNPANQFILYDDIPLFWDAWDVMDFHQESKKVLTDILFGATIREEGPLRASVETSIKISDRSYLNHLIVLDAESPYIKVHTEVHWHESRKFLKVEFPCDIVTDHVTYDSQYGFIRRPNHQNTSWDSAKYEVCCQKWFDFSDYNVGVAILNDSKYGCSVKDAVLSLSLLRSPKYPDEQADMGAHKFTHAIMPHQGSFQSSGVIQAAYNINYPLFTLKNSSVYQELNRQVVTSSDTSIVVATIKMSECDRERKEGSRSLIIRCYEAHGGSTSTRISTGFPLLSAFLCDGLEQSISEISLDETKSNFILHFTPHQIKTVKLVTSSDNVNRETQIVRDPIERETVEDKKVLQRSQSRFLNS